MNNINIPYFLVHGFKQFDTFKRQFQMILNGTLGSGIVTLEQDYI